MSINESRRVFFALLPAQPLRLQIKSLTKHLHLENKQVVNPDNYHITLSFMGAHPATKIACFQAIGDRIQPPSFTLQLDHLGCWKKPAVAWLGLTTVPEPLHSLVTSINEQLRTQCGIEPEPRPYQPHITLLRKVRALPPTRPFTPLQWWVSSFALMESTRIDGVLRYVPLQQWTVT